MTTTRRRRISGIAMRIGVIVLPAYVAFLTGMFMVMRQPPQRFGRIMRHVPMPTMALMPFESMWNVARGGALRVGDPAPDFTLPRSDKSGDVRLSALRGRPVVLVFGSYT
jgi:hypothetical protein